MATKIYRVKSKGVKMIIRRRGSDYADSEFDLWGGRGDAPLERGDPFSPTLFTEGFSFIASTIREDL